MGFWRSPYGAYRGAQRAARRDAARRPGAALLDVLTE
jgi:hypothetical protein